MSGGSASPCRQLQSAPLGALVTVGEQRGHPGRAPRGGGACGQHGRGEARWAGIRAAVLSTSRLCPPFIWAG